MTLMASGGGRRRSIAAALCALAGDEVVVVPGAGADKIAADALVSRLFRDEGTALVRLARLFTDDRSAAEDLVQEAFIRLHRSAGRIRDPEKAAPYLRSIVLNLARDHNRRGLMSLRHAVATRAGSVATPMEDIVVEAAEHRRVVEVLRDLPPRQRDCLVLRFFYEMTERQTGEALGISPNSVKTHCRRGLAALGALLEGES